LIIDLHLSLANGSQIQAASTSGDAGRSEALSLLVIDEAAHVENLDELWAGLYPTISTGGRVIALSTPNGVGNWFHKTYTEAAREK
jgi:phage FluMu gp28-like protein